MTAPRVDRRHLRGDQTASALLKAATHAFAEHGYAGASVRDIAQAADANSALVAYHFGSKEGLYLAVLDAAMGALDQRLRLVVSGATDTEDLVARLVDAYSDYLGKNPDFPRVLQRALLDRDTRVQRIAKKHLRPLLKLMPSALRRPPAAMADLEQHIISLFGAVVVPYLYAPLLSEVFGHDVLADDVLERRRCHLREVVTRAVGSFLHRAVS